jgi:molecular chaperone DnaK
MGFNVGIDLGTTNSVVCYVDHKNNFIRDESGSFLIPSVVCYAPEKFVGKDAIDNEENFPEDTIRSSKRLIGQNLSLHPVKDISATIVASDILIYLKQLTESYLDRKIDGLVITVPAYFNQNQRIETKKAAESAGFNVLRIINEPTAAALAYGTSAQINELVLVYDLGGGTFDVTLLQLSNDNIYQVLSTSGNTSLGGDDFDNLIVEFFKKTIPEDFKPFKDFDVRLKKFAEEIKIQLNYKDVVKKTLRYCGTINSKIYHHNFELTSSHYQSMIEFLLLKTKSNVLNALNDANKKISNLSKIILVGGSTKSKFVREFIKKEFNTKVFFDIDPDLTVAAGAATLAYSIENKGINDAVLIDVTPLSLGIEIKGGIMNKIIPRNSNIPISSSQEFNTVEDNQELVNIKIFQGERPLVKDNEFLGEFELSGFEKRPKGQTKIIIKFDIDNSGLITVSAYDKISGIQSEVVLKSITTDRIYEHLDNAETFIESDYILSKQIELNQAREDCKAMMIKKTLLDTQLRKDLQDTFDSVKDNIVQLRTFMQSLKDE